MKLWILTKVIKAQGNQKLLTNSVIYFWVDNIGKVKNKELLLYHLKVIKWDSSKINQAKTIITRKKLRILDQVYYYNKLSYK